MTVFALDTSSRAASCALLRDGALLGEFFIHTSLTHSETMMPMAEALLQSTRVAVDAIDLFAVSVGPGSFTGLRIGIASVKGMAMASSRPCVGVSTLAALAENLSTFTGYLVPAMDARRAQVYTALFDCENGQILRKSEDEALSVQALRGRIEALAPAPVCLLGDGAALCYEQMRDLTHLRCAPENLMHQRAGSVARVAERMAAAGETLTAAALAPRYLRLPQAERERLARLER